MANGPNQWVNAYTHAGKIWAAINWKGKLEDRNAKHKPSDSDFKMFYDGRAAMPNNRPMEVQDHHINIPLLDDQVTEGEVRQLLHRLKANKACGPDGIPVSTFKVLPAVWIIYLVALFNAVFSSTYPISWTTVKLFTICKKGNRLLPENYRGISVVTGEFYCQNL